MFEKMVPNQVITHAEMENGTGVNCRAPSEGYRASIAARSFVFHDSKIVLRTVHKVGIKRVEDHGMLFTGSHGTSSERRRARRARERKDK